MLITPKSISPLARFITGDIEQTPYLSGPKLIDLFNSYGFDDKYGSDFPSRWLYVEKKLEDINNTNHLMGVLEELIDDHFYLDKEEDLETAVKYFQPTILIKMGFYGIGIFYGLATLVTGIFPCDSGYNKELIDPSFSQLTHNFAALLMYLFVPINIIIIGIGLKRLTNYNRLSIIAITSGIISILFVYLLFSDLTSEFLGLYQRIIESVFIIWILTCAFTIKNEEIV